MTNKINNKKLKFFGLISFLYCICFLVIQIKLIIPYFTIFIFLSSPIISILTVNYCITLIFNKFVKKEDIKFDLIDYVFILIGFILLTIVTYSYFIFFNFLYKLKDFH